jgi:hypothetical protein
MLVIVNLVNGLAVSGVNQHTVLGIKNIWEVHKISYSA